MTSRISRALVGDPDASRVPLLDNARFAVMLLVVAGHALATMRDVPGVLAGYLWLYAFHMPLFVLLSGYTAARYRGEPRQVRRMVGTLVWPFLLVGMLLTAQRNLLADRPLLEGYTPVEAPWLLWFIVALFLWRLSTPIWRALRFPVTTAVVVSLVSGMFPIPDVWGLPQVFGLLPFYVLGLAAAERPAATLTGHLARPGVRLLAGAVLLTTLALATQLDTRLELRWVYWSHHYGSASLGVEPLTGMAVRLGLLGLGLALALAFLCWVPQRRAWFSALGERTLYAYLLHGFVVRWARSEGWVRDAADLGLAGAVLVLLAALAVGVVLMSRPVGRTFRPVFEPRLRWLFREDAPASGERRAVVERE